MKFIIQFIKNHKLRFLFLIYIPLYILAFKLVEFRTVDNYHYLNHSIDDDIPFWEIFVIPYFLWFGYLAFGIIKTVFTKNGLDFYLLGMNLAIGMTLFIIVSFLWPNAIDIRPETMPRDNILTKLVSFLYFVDTPTNVLPSIHVYNSIGVHIGLCRTKLYKERPVVQGLSALAMVLICLSTMFIKQHSVVDVLAGIALQFIVYIFTYGHRNSWLLRLAEKVEPGCTA